MNNFLLSGYCLHLPCRQIPCDFYISVNHHTLHVPARLISAISIYCQRTNFTPQATQKMLKRLKQNSHAANKPHPTTKANKKLIKSRCCNTSKVKKDHRCAFTCHTWGRSIPRNLSHSRESKPSRWPVTIIEMYALINSNR